MHHSLLDVILNSQTRLLKHVQITAVVQNQTTMLNECIVNVRCYDCLMTVHKYTNEALKYCIFLLNNRTEGNVQSSRSLAG